MIFSLKFVTGWNGEWLARSAYCRTRCAALAKCLFQAMTTERTLSVKRKHILPQFCRRGKFIPIWTNGFRRIPAYSSLFSITKSPFYYLSLCLTMNWERQYHTIKKLTLNKYWQKRAITLSRFHFSIMLNARSLELHSNISVSESTGLEIRVLQVNYLTALKRNYWFFLRYPRNILTNFFICKKPLIYINKSLLC